MQTQEGWPINQAALRTTAHQWQTRTAAYARNSFLAAYSTFIDNTLVAVLQWLRIDELFRKLTPWLEDSLATLTRKPQHKHVYNAVLKPGIVWFLLEVLQGSGNCSMSQVMSLRSVHCRYAGCQVCYSHMSKILVVSVHSEKVCFQGT